MTVCLILSWQTAMTYQNWIFQQLMVIAFVTININYPYSHEILPL